MLTYLGYTKTILRIKMKIKIVIEDQKHSREEDNSIHCVKGV
jgi:hypothetical protein